MTAQHWLAAGLVLTGLATAIGSLEDWNQATTPMFVSGVLVQIGGTIVALFSKSVRKEQ